MTDSQHEASKRVRITGILQSLSSAEIMIGMLPDYQQEEVYKQLHKAAKKAIEEIKAEPEPRPKAKVILFKPSGKYYTEEEWLIPTEEEARTHPSFMAGDMISPYCMIYSPDFRRISLTGKVLVVTQEPWGYPHLL